MAGMKIYLHESIQRCPYLSNDRIDCHLDTYNKASHDICMGLKDQGDVVGPSRITCRRS